LIEGPQRISRRDDTVILLAQQEYDRLTGVRPGFKEFLLKQTPNLDDLALNRDKSGMREVDL